jgi:hypothetical protein
VTNANFNQPTTGAVTDIGDALLVTNDGGGGAVSARSEGGIALRGHSGAGSGPAILGRSPDSDGVVGSSDTGTGVRGESSAQHGVHGYTKATGGSGVRGEAVESGGLGVHATSELGPALLAQSTVDHGVEGETEGDRKAGVIGVHNGGFVGFGLMGLVRGQRENDLREFSVGVFGEAPDGIGVVGISERLAGMQGTSDQGAGVQGIAKADGAGVSGLSEDGPGLSGASRTGTGVHGTSDSKTLAGIEGEHGAGGTGVRGSTTGKYSGTNDMPIGVAGEATAGGYGVKGLATGGHTAIAGSASDVDLTLLSALDPAGIFGVGDGAGLAGWAVSPAGAAISAWGDVNVAGGFINVVGGVNVAGSLKVVGGSKQFWIDHPLDPQNRYLCHAAVEAPELKTLYDGTTNLDESGEARVELPDWFGELNTDLCYFLTSLGGPAPELHIAEEYDGHGFRIGGGMPEGRVSWQVTGVRHDASARAHPLVVEQEKEGDEEGRYLEPDLYDGDGTLRSIPWLEEARRRAGILDEVRHNNGDPHALSEIIEKNMPTVPQADSAKR